MSTPISTAKRTYEIKHEVGIKAAPEEVYRAIIDPKQLAKWWTTEVKGDSKIGNTLEFWFDNFCQKMEVMVLESNRKICWRATADGVPLWSGTEIEFTLNYDEGQTILNFCHSGWKDNTDMYPHCSTKWAVFLLSLKDFLENGKGRPYPNDWQINHY